MSFDRRQDDLVSRKPPTTVGQEVQVSVVLSVLAGELTLVEAARRHRVAAQTVANWRDRFVTAGREGLNPKMHGPHSGPGSVEERRLRAEDEQLKLALAEAVVQVRIWLTTVYHAEAGGSVTGASSRTGTSRSMPVPSQTARP